jgi:hypothetical protein
MNIGNIHIVLIARIDLPSSPFRLRDKEHCKFVASQPCIVCGRTPCEAHHIRFAQRRAPGRKVSDEFTVPVCRLHHRELHNYGDEASWWAGVSIDTFLSPLSSGDTRGSFHCHKLSVRCPAVPAS